MSRSILGALGLVFVVGCHPRPTEVVDDVRPALTLLVGASAPRDRSFVGSLESRSTTELAFRVGGRVLRRSVSVGDRVKRGQEIAVLDRRSLQLAVNAAAADVARATANRASTALTLSRGVALLASQAVAPASVDSTRSSRDVASANVDEASARLDKARQELGYGVLRSDFDGVITRVDFEVEEVVAPNVVVAEIVPPDAFDFVFDVPESTARELRVGDAFDVRHDDTSAVATRGKVRQIDPTADLTTRTRRIRVALDAAPGHLRPGTTMYARRSGDDAPSVHVPATAVLEDAGSPAVWVVDQGVVRRRDVALGARDGADVLVPSGLRPGERIVTAGVHSLRDGQRVKVAAEATR